MRDLAKVSTVAIQDPSAKTTEQVLVTHKTILIIVIYYLCSYVPSVPWILLHCYFIVVVYQSDAEANDSEAVTVTKDVVCSSNGDISAVTAER